MALRVLLADESVTIKKVLQLALQDYAALVSTVTVGIDVLQAAQQFRPDIIFVDVILQKKNGYDVCQELKQHPHFSKIPVVLVWSGFMDLDIEKYKSSLANANLEKPFDSAKLHNLVKQLVPKTKTQQLTDHLTFPKLPEFKENEFLVKPSIPHTKSELTIQDGLTTRTQAGSWSMDSFAPIPQDESFADEPGDEFLSVELPAEPLRPPTLSKPDKLSTFYEQDDEAEWVQKTLSKYKLDPSKRIDSDLKVKTDTPENSNHDSSIVVPAWTGQRGREFPEEDTSDLFELDLTNDATDDSTNDDIANSTANTRRHPTESTASHLTAPHMSAKSQISEAELTEIIRAQSQETIEKIVWQVLPDVAARIIEREIERLLNERKKL